jgi:hypothetical protein
LPHSKGQALDESKQSAIIFQLGIKDQGVRSPMAVIAELAKRLSKSAISAFFLEMLRAFPFLFVPLQANCYEEPHCRPSI